MEIFIVYKESPFLHGWSKDIVGAYADEDSARLLCNELNDMVSQSDVHYFCKPILVKGTIK